MGVSVRNRILRITVKSALICALALSTWQKGHSQERQFGSDSRVAYPDHVFDSNSPHSESPESAVLNRSQQKGLDELEVPLLASYRDGFGMRSADDQFQLRLKFLTQIDAKLFTPTDQDPARSGMYIPRFRTYFEGQMRDGYEYELSLQRSVEGSFDLLDANINFRPSEAFQLRVGRSLTPYSYAWYDHLEQFYITP